MERIHFWTPYLRTHANVYAMCVAVGVAIGLSVRRRS